MQSSRWLDLKGMCESLTKKHQQLDLVRYFTTRVKNNPGASQRQGTFIDALEARGGIKIDYGHFLSKKTKCHSCGNEWTSSEEKKTDVNIAIRLLEDAHDGRFDTAIVVSGDSDLAPAIQSILSRTPKKRVVVAFPPKRHSSELQRVASGHFKIPRKSILSNHLPAVVTTPSGRPLKAPEGWLPQPAN